MNQYGRWNFVSELPTSIVDNERQHLCITCDDSVPMDFSMMLQLPNKIQYQFLNLGNWKTVLSIY